MMMTEEKWATLLTRIRSGTCTPFLGAGVNNRLLPLGGDIAQNWAASFGYPLDSKRDLAKVAQFIATKTDQTRPKELILKLLDEQQSPLDFNDDDETLNILAKLELPVYLTTNYDDLLLQAIDFHGRSTGRKGKIEICRWNKSLAWLPSMFKSPLRYSPSKQTPLIYHLHGHKSVKDSLVLTEDDYLDFLVNMSKDSKFLPPRIQEAIIGSSILFIGYSLADIDFRVLFRGLLGNLEASASKMSLAVQLPYEDAHPNKQDAEAYITRYFEKAVAARNSELLVYWGTAREFGRELWTRWRKFND